MATSAVFSQRGMRADFKSEVARLLKIIKECEETEKALAQASEGFTTKFAGKTRLQLTQKGAGGLYIRLTEQRLSNRRLKLDAVERLRVIRKDITDREYRLAKAAVETEAAAASSGATAELLRSIQGMLVGRSAARELLEPPPLTIDATADEIIDGIVGDDPALAELEPDEDQSTVVLSDEGEGEEEPPPPDLPDPDFVSPGDIVSDPSGRLWVIGEGGSPEDAGGNAASVHLEVPEGTPQYAVLEDGRAVLVFEV